MKEGDCCGGGRKGQHTCEVCPVFNMCEMSSTCPPSSAVSGTTPRWKRYKGLSRCKIGAKEVQVPQAHTYTTMWSAALTYTATHKKKMREGEKCPHNVIEADDRGVANRVENRVVSCSGNTRRVKRTSTSRSHSKRARDPAHLKGHGGGGGGDEGKTNRVRSCGRFGTEQNRFEFSINLDY